MTRIGLVVFVLLTLLNGRLVFSAGAEESDFLGVVQRYVRTMIEQGRGRYGPQKSGLFLSALAT
jgi:hypothetical protein